MGLEEQELKQLQRGALLHDLGKVGVPARILDKEDTLTESEFEQMKDHTRIGGRILEPLRAFRTLIPLVRNHHERFDGNGYPDGLSGQSIPLLVRILTLADAYDAMTSDRPYRHSMPKSVALTVIRLGAGLQFDPHVASVFLDVVARRDGPRSKACNQKGRNPDLLTQPYLSSPGGDTWQQ
jgi:HD-GYP domain-containing protein (c-di-GMP phosphodiesterase class II)